MASVDISPQELRDIEIREAWRGYHRDDVDELLERAAATIEHLDSENSQLRARLAQGGAAAPRPAVQPAAPQPAPAPARTPDTDVIQRTLVLAQKAADEAVAEAKAKAGQIVAESEAKAQQLVADAEANARRIADTEKARLEEDIARLSSARDSLTSDVDALEQFAEEYRSRVRSAIEAELELLESGISAPARPTVSEVSLPSSTGGPSWSASQQREPTPPPEPRSSGTPTVHIEAVPAAGPEWDAPPAREWGDAAAAVDDAREPADDTHGGGGDSLDDDAFFASLREAVRDDAPLGPGNEDDTAFFDQEDTDEHRRLFKRRR
jgi:DivIVA domain-containing protein